MTHLDEPTGDDVDKTTIEGDPAATVVETPKCYTRGLNPRAALSWVRRRHGDDSLARVLGALRQEDRDIVKGAGQRTWIPFLAHARLLETIDEVLGKGDTALLRRVGRYMGEHDFPLVARPFIRLASPGFFIDKAMKLWGIYHSRGRWEMTRASGTVQATLVDHPEHHQAFCATFVGWMEGALSLTGATDPLAHETRCAAKGAPCCSFEVTWLDSEGPQRTRAPRPPT